WGSRASYAEGRSGTAKAIWVLLFTRSMESHGAYPPRSFFDDDRRGHGLGVASGPFDEAVPGGLRFVVLVQEAGGSAEDAGTPFVGPGEPPDAFNFPADPVAGEHFERLGELVGLALGAALPAGRAARRAPAELGDVDRRGGVAVLAHDAAEVVQLRAHRFRLGDVRVERDAVEVGLDVARLVDAPEEVAGGDVGRDLQRPAEQPADQHLRPRLGGVERAPRDPQQPRVFGRFGFARLGDDVLLVPDLPVGDRQVVDLPVLFPEFAVGAVAPRRFAEELLPRPALPARLHRQVDGLGGDPFRRAPDER